MAMVNQPDCFLVIYKLNNHEFLLPTKNEKAKARMDGFKKPHSGYLFSAIVYVRTSQKSRYMTDQSGQISINYLIYRFFHNYKPLPLI